MNLKTLDKVGRFLYFGTIVPVFLSLVTPLIIQDSFLFPFISPKVFFFRTVIEISLFFYILLAIKEPAFRPKMSRLTYIVTGFILVATIASVFGIDPYRSFWGNIERGEGLLTLYHVFAMFFIITQTFKSRRILTSLLHALALSVFAVSIYAFRQFLDVDGVINTSGSRLSATIGNASFFAGYLLFGIFLSAWFAFSNRYLWVRIAYTLIGLFEIFILVRTETRGAFIGLIVGALVSVLACLFLSNKKTVKIYATASILIIILSSVIVWWQRESPLVNNVALLRRLTTISFDDVTTQSRLLTWDSSWQGAKDRPILGYGWENYNVAFNKYFNPGIYRDQGSQIWFDRAHNIVFDVLVSSGIVGLLFYMLLFLYPFRILYLHHKKTNDSTVTAVFSGLLIAYGISNLFVFDVLATYINFYVLLAFIVYLERKNSNSTSGDMMSGQNGFASCSNTFAISTITLGILLVISIYQFNIRHALINQEGLNAYRYSVTNNPQKARQVFENVLKNSGYQLPEIRQKYAEFAIRYANSNNQNFSSSLLSSAISEIKKTIKEHPYDVQNRMLLMILYNRSDQFDPRRIDRLFEEGVRALELSPTRPQIYYELAQGYMARGEFEKGLEQFKKALELQPDVFESRWSVAVSLIYNNRLNEALQMFDNMIGDGFNYYTDQNLSRMESVFRETSNWSQLAITIGHRIKINPKNADLYLRQAVAYELAGELESAYRAIEDAVKVDPGAYERAQEIKERIELKTPSDGD